MTPRQKVMIVVGKIHNMLHIDGVLVHLSESNGGQAYDRMMYTYAEVFDGEK